ncbi:MAG: permease [Desulfurococcaceae archaeon]
MDSLIELFDATTIGFIAAVVIFFILVLSIRGLNNAIAGVSGGIHTFARYSLLIILSMILAGLIQKAVPKEVISEYLGSASGWRGVALGTLIGALFPGAPYAALPLFASFIKMGAGAPAVVSMTASWGLISIGRMPYQAAVMGGRLTAIYVVSVFALPIAAGYIALVIEKALSY